MCVCVCFFPLGGGGNLFHSKILKCHEIRPAAQAIRKGLLEHVLNLICHDVSKQGKTIEDIKYHIIQKSAYGLCCEAVAFILKMFEDV